MVDWRDKAIDRLERQVLALDKRVEGLEKLTLKLRRFLTTEQHTREVLERAREGYSGLTPEESHKLRG